MSTTLEGVTNGSVGAEQAYEVRLEPWTQVGTPFGYAVPFDTVLAASGLTGAEIDGPVGYRSGSYRREVAVLKPWRRHIFFMQRRRQTRWSYAVGGAPTTSGPEVLARRANGGVDRSEPSTPHETTKSGTGEERRAELKLGDDRETVGSVEAVQSRPEAGQGETKRKREGEEEGYTLKIDGRKKGGSAEREWAGLRAGAKLGRDALDFAQPPEIGVAVRLSIRERVRGRVVSHAGSFKPAGGVGRSWDVVLRNQMNEKQSVRRVLRPEGRRPEGHGRYVLDLMRVAVWHRRRDCTLGRETNGR